MKIVIVRHGDPNYENDSLTEKGKVEAELVAELLKNEKVDHVYVSPLGRAKQTCEYYLKKTGKQAIEKKWLKEFGFSIYHEDDDIDMYPWDYQPDFWTDKEFFYDKDKWKDYHIYRESKIDEEYNWVISEFDRLLENHGYKREANHYKVLNSNHDVLIFFCHFGLECVLLSRLLDISPFVLWHHTCALTTSVTRVVSEERKKGYATFRMTEYGSIDHLRRANEPPSKSALFTECYLDEDRH